MAISNAPLLLSNRAPYRKFYAPIAGRQPYSSVREIFEFRDALAHGRTTVDKMVDLVVEDKGSFALSLPGPDWARHRDT